MPSSIPEVEGNTPVLGQTCIDLNRRAWNGVDYTVFTEEHKRKIRAHYAALVKAIDHEVGEIIGMLRERALLGNTLIVLSSDHGDYLGDHNLIGKSSFYETCMRLPMIVQGPGVPAGQVSGGLVELRDVTATMLAAAEVDIPSHMDSRPLPGIGLTDEPARERIFGMLADRWMNYDGRWKLARYATGETTLFDREADCLARRGLRSAPGRLPRSRTG